jgi:Fungal Zn(2)-Cys(6) binuclear cluster domain/Fungal specific transcription factor domain
MPSRQFHGKSRHGCKTCKKRKVRCDLGRPVCANCTRLSRECEYAEQLGPAGIQQGESANQLIQLAPPRSIADSSEGDGGGEGWILNLLDLELMHHFTAFTAVRMSDIPTTNQLWTTVIPQIGFRHPFLLHGILSMAALHRRTDPAATEFQQAALLDLARDHQQQALSEYIPLLGNITSDNCHALFAFSQIIAAVSYALLHLARGQNTAQDFVQGIVAVFDLLIGSVVIAFEAKEALRRGELASLMGHGPSLLDWNMAPLSDEPEAALAALVDRVQNMSPGSRLSPDSGSGAAGMPGQGEYYVSAIQKLHPLFPRHPQSTPRISTVIGWPVFLDASYIALLRREEHAALVVLAYYGVTLYKLNECWWLQGLGASLVLAVSEIVGEEWKGYLNWPRNEVLGEA